MTDIETLMPAGGRTAQDAGSRRLRFLAVVDGSEATNRIVEFIVSVAQDRDAMEAVVLNVQDLRADARLRGYQSFKKEEIEDRLVNELGRPIVNGVSTWLRKAGVASSSKVEIGDPASIILRCAAEERCDLIVIGEPPPAVFRRWIAAATGLRLASSLTSHLIATAPRPVVVVK